jgi:hypothetical protein
MADPLVGFVGVRGEEVAEPVETAFPQGPPLVDPVLGRAQRGRLDRAGAHPPDLLRADEAAGLEHLDVLDHRRERHLERLRELAHRRRPTRQAVDHRAAAGVSERVEDLVERRMVKQLLNFGMGSTQSQAIA